MNNVNDLNLTLVKKWYKHEAQDVPGNKKSKIVCDYKRKLSKETRLDS